MIYALVLIHFDNRLLKCDHPRNTEVILPDKGTSPPVTEPAKPCWQPSIAVERRNPFFEPFICTIPAGKRQKEIFEQEKECVPKRKKKKKPSFCFFPADEKGSTLFINATLRK
ncbi:hypothetical protein NPIL_56471 [Nephila pilipes]|uniref:Uncharacterized protein n=1 Tax=Nephila pilipes TaxID=299642 RepID=A0A8X6TSL2_NEPPI|nr:hypothetical protein NPIL_56471 [Nephila pilipes]